MRVLGAAMALVFCPEKQRIGIEGLAGTQAAISRSQDT